MFKPMLAGEADLAALRFPLLASPKLDGVRAIVRGGVVYSRSNKPIPNKHVQSLFANCEHMDGELIFGDPRSKSCYRDTVSFVMSHDKVSMDIWFYVFDHVADVGATYMNRRMILKSAVLDDPINVVLHLQCRIGDVAELLTYESECLEQGYEGLILRDPHSAYKMGRSTTKEQILLKLKRFEDAEATVIGFEERMENTNEKVTNELGRGQRSSHASGKIGRGDLGALVARTAEGIEFCIGTGFDDNERGYIWTNRSNYLGALVKYKFFAVGVKTAPRHPVFIGWRDVVDT